ncbi:MAG: hypothetical protein Q8S73_17380 [Deltaproteobacteria bacterium]|nr:hypothetical protein [Deltaproteobacteria bacterium]
MAIEPLERTMFGPPSFRVSFEQRDMEGRWRTVYDGSGSDGASPDSTPLAPGDSRPLRSYQLTADGELTPGTWRAITRYRDPRHPAFPSHAEAVFEIVGLSTTQAESVLAALASPAHRECGASSELYYFVRTAPHAMLPRLLELPGATVAEREDALVELTATTRDQTLLRRAMLSPEPSMRLAASRALGRVGDRDHTLPSLSLWLDAMREIYPRWMGDGVGEADDLPTLFGLLPDMPPPVLARLLQRLADRSARDLSVAIAAHLGWNARRIARAQLPLIARALARTAARETHPATRAYYLHALHDCTAALDNAPSAALRPTESSLPPRAPRGPRSFEACVAFRDALRPMTELALHPDRMQFIHRDPPRASVPSLDPVTTAPTYADEPVRLPHPTCGLALQDTDVGLPMYGPGPSRLNQEMVARGVECVLANGRVAWTLPPTTVRSTFVEAMREVFCGLSARMYAVEARHNPRRYRLEIARLDDEGARNTEAWVQPQLLLRAPEQGLHHSVRIEAEVRDVHVDGSWMTFSAVLDQCGRERFAVSYPAEADARIANGARAVIYGVVTGSSVEPSCGGPSNVPQVMAFHVVPREVAGPRPSPSGSPRPDGRP